MLGGFEMPTRRRYRDDTGASAVEYGLLVAAVAGNPYTGLFQGADSGLLRLSVTGDPADRGFAPGLANVGHLDRMELV